MRRIWAGCVAALTLLGAGAAEAANIQDEFLAALKSMQQGRCDAGKMRRITTRPQFAELTGAQRSVVWASLAVCDSANQHEFALKAVAEPDAVAMAYGVRFADAVEREETDAALAAVEAVAAAARDGDDSVVWFGDDYVYELARKVDEDPAKFRRFMAGLEDAAWKAERPHYGGDWMFARYAGMLVSAGERAHAWRVVTRVEDPGELARMSLDKRFDDVVALDPRRFDLMGAAERQLGRGKALLAKNPRDGSALSLTTEALRYLGRQQDALDAVDPVLAKRDPILDSDGEDHRNWTLNDRALILLELGRFEDAVAGMKAAAAVKEGDGPNVSQTINLAGLQIAAGQYDAAIATLAVFDVSKKSSMSPYGAMWVQAERACAHARLGKTAEAAAEVGFTAEHAKDNWNARTKALLCVDDLETLAGVYKARLADEEDRADALLELSRFKPLPNPSAFDTALGARMQTIRARPDIQAAIAAVGRTREFPIHAASLVDAY